MGKIENLTFEKFYGTIEKNTEVNKMIENGKIYKYKINQSINQFMV